MTGRTLSRTDLARLIDHTNLQPGATEADIWRLCVEAIEYGYYSVCVNPCWISLAASLLRDQPVKVCSVVGFPLGASRSAIKAAEAELAVSDGAAELDMVINVGAMRSGDRQAVMTDIAAVRDAAGKDVVLKVIIEAALLTPELKELAARIVADSGADFVKTSTGFITAGGATVEDVRLLKAVVGSRVKVKAAGGIRDLRTALELVEAGAGRLGTSASVAIVEALPVPTRLDLPESR